ncbi:MAG: hypothetical protein PHY94_05475 [Candidatus Omnitrophica bacterium]|nr:hypothetical protein [Candidatus Omnitrophota bacterium]
MSEKLRLKIGENEIELEGEAKFIDAYLKLFLDNQGITKQPLAESKGKPGLPGKVFVTKPKRDMTPAEYVREKKPNGRTEYLIVFAKYLDEYRSLAEFSKKDIATTVRMAKVKPIEGAYYTLAVKQGLLNKLSHGRYQLTMSGEDAVSAMPVSSK